MRTCHFRVRSFHFPGRQFLGALACALLLLTINGPLSAQSPNPASAKESLRVVTIAGTPSETGFQDGDARSSLFSRPTWVEYDQSGRVYVVDRQNSAIRAIRGSEVYTLRVYTDLTLSTVQLNFGAPYGGGIASEPTVAGCGAGPYCEALIVSSTGSHQVMMITDASREGWGEGTAFIAARDDRPAAIGTVNQPGFRDGPVHASYGPDTTALLNTPGDIALSAGYQGQARLGDAVFIADTNNHVIRRAPLAESFEGCDGFWNVETLAGLAGSAGHADGEPTAARFNSPRGIATAPDGSVYVADSGNHVIRRIGQDGFVSTIAGRPGVSGFADGNAEEALLNWPAGIAINELGEVFIADSANHCIRQLTLDGRLVTIAGTPSVSGFRDGEAATSLFAGPVGITLSPEGIIIGDTSNNVIRRIEKTPARRRPVRQED